MNLNVEIPSEIDSLFALNDKSVVISETFYEAAKMFIVAHYNIRQKTKNSSAVLKVMLSGPSLSIEKFWVKTRRFLYNKWWFSFRDGLIDFEHLFFHHHLLLDMFTQSNLGNFIFLLNCVSCIQWKMRKFIDLYIWKTKKFRIST